MNLSNGAIEIEIVKMSFTFQYGKIKVKTPDDMPNSFATFTFQYGEI